MRLEDKAGWICLILSFTNTYALKLPEWGVLFGAMGMGFFISSLIKQYIEKQNNKIPVRAKRVKKDSDDIHGER